MKSFNKIGTHSGAFHVDEVLACCMLRTLPQFQSAEIVRTRVGSELDKCDIVVDVGGVFDKDKLRFDHHQRTFNHSMSTILPSKPWTTKLSSAGLIYAHYGEDVISQVIFECRKAELDDEQKKRMVEVIFDKVYANFVEEIDGQDNGITAFEGKPRYRITTTLGSRVANIRPPWNAPEAVRNDLDSAFMNALELVKGEFLDKIRYYGDVWWPARSTVIQVIENRFKVDESGRIIDFSGIDCPVPFKEHLFDLEKELGIEGEILFAIFKSSDDNSHRVLAINVENDGFNSRLPLKSEWRGLRDQELSSVSGNEDCIFVHASGFTGGHKTREGALKMARDTLLTTGKN